MKKSKIYTTICIILIFAFSFENILWANPTVFQGDTPSRTLQVPSFFSTPENALKSMLMCLVTIFPDIESFKYRLTPRVAGVELDLDFYQQHKEGDNIVIPCSLVSGGSCRLYEAVIHADKSVSLRKQRKEKPAASDPDPADPDPPRPSKSKVKGARYKIDQLINDTRKFIKQKKYNKAEEALDKAHKLFVKYQDAQKIQKITLKIIDWYITLFTAYETKKKSKKLRNAVEKFEGVIKTNPKDIIALTVLADLYLKVREPELAIKLAKKVTDTPDLPINVWKRADRLINAAQKQIRKTKQEEEIKAEEEKKYATEGEEKAIPDTVGEKLLKEIEQKEKPRRRTKQPKKRTIDERINELDKAIREEQRPNVRQLVEGILRPKLVKARKKGNRKVVSRLESAISSAEQFLSRPNNFRKGTLDFGFSAHIKGWLTKWRKKPAEKPAVPEPAKPPKIKEEEILEEIIRLHKRANSFIYRKDLNKAEETFNKAYDIFTEYPEAANIRDEAAYIIGGYHKLAAAFIKRKNLNKAKKILNRTHDMFIEYPESANILDSTAYIVGNYNSLAMAFLKQKNLDKSEELLNKSYGIFTEYPEAKNVLDSASYLVGSFHQLATAFRRQGNFDKAEELLNEAYEIYIKYPEAKNIQNEAQFIISNFHSVATVFRKQGKPNKAEKPLNKAYDIFAKYPEAEGVRSQTRFIVGGYHNLAATFIKQKNLDKSEELLNKSYGIFTEYPEAPNIRDEAAYIIGGYHKLAVAFIKRKNLDKAEKALNKTYEILTGYPDARNIRNQPTYIMAGYHSLAFAFINLAKQKEFDKAENTLNLVKVEKALNKTYEIFIDYPDAKDVKGHAEFIISGYTVLANAFREQKNLDKAEKIFNLDKAERALDITYEIFTGYPDVKNVLDEAVFIIRGYNNLAKTLTYLIKQEDLDEAERILFLDKVERATNRAYGIFIGYPNAKGVQEEAAYIVQCFMGLFSRHYWQKDKLQKKLKKALKDFETIVHSNPKDIVASTVLAFLYLKVNQFRDAEATAKKVKSTSDLTIAVGRIAQDIVERAEERIRGLQPPHKEETSGEEEYRPDILGGQNSEQRLEVLEAIIRRMVKDGRSKERIVSKILRLYTYVGQLNALASNPDPVISKYGKLALAKVSESRKKPGAAVVSLPGDEMEVVNRIIKKAREIVNTAIQEEEEGHKTIFDLLKLYNALTKKEGEDRMCVLPPEAEEALKKRNLKGYFDGKKRVIVDRLRWRFRDRQNLVRDGKIEELGELSSRETLIYLQNNPPPEAEIKEAWDELGEAHVLGELVPVKFAAITRFGDTKNPSGFRVIYKDTIVGFMHYKETAKKIQTHFIHLEENELERIINKEKEYMVRVISIGEIPDDRGPAFSMWPEAGQNLFGNGTLRLPSGNELKKFFFGSLRVILTPLAVLIAAIIAVIFTPHAADHIAHMLHISTHATEHIIVNIEIFKRKFFHLMDTSVEKLLLEELSHVNKPLFEKIKPHLVEDWHKHFLEIPKERLLELKRARKKKDIGKILERIKICTIELANLQKTPNIEERKICQYENLNALGFLYATLGDVDFYEGTLFPRKKVRKKVHALTTDILETLEKAVDVDSNTVAISVAIAHQLKEKELINTIKFRGFIWKIHRITKEEAFDKIGHQILIDELIGLGENKLVIDLSLNRQKNKTIIHKSYRHDRFGEWLEKEIKAGRIEKDLPLILFDYHHDANRKREELDSDTWVYHAQDKGLIGDIHWVYPEWSTPLHDGGIIEVKEGATIKLDFASIVNNIDELTKIEGPVLVSIDFDYFSYSGFEPSPRGFMYHRPSKQEIKDAAKKLVNSLLKQNIEIKVIDLTETGPPLVVTEDVDAIKKALSEELKRLGVSEKETLTVDSALRYSQKLYQYGVVASDYLISNRTNKEKYWGFKIKQALESKDEEGVKALSALRDADLRPLWGNLLIDKNTKQGILIFGKRDSGKSLVTARLLGFDVVEQKGKADSQWIFGGDDRIQGFFVKDKLLAGAEPRAPKTLAFKDKFKRNTPVSAIATEKFAEIELIVFLNLAADGEKLRLVNEEKIERIRQLHLAEELSEGFCKKLAKVNITEIPIPEETSSRDYGKVVKAIDEGWSKIQRKPEIGRHPGYLGAKDNSLNGGIIGEDPIRVFADGSFKKLEQHEIGKYTVLRLFKQNLIENWGDTTKEARLHLVRLLAKELGKNPGELISADFVNRKIKVFNNKRLQSLLRVYLRRNKLSGKGSLTKAVKILKEDLGIEDLIIPKMEVLKFMEEDWQKTKEILKVYEGYKNLPYNLQEFLAENPLNKPVLSELVLDAREGNQASYLVLHLICKKHALKLLDKYSQHLEEEDLSDLLTDVLERTILWFDEQRDVKFTTYFWISFRGVLWNHLRRLKQKKEKEVSLDTQASGDAHMPSGTIDIETLNHDIHPKRKPVTLTDHDKKEHLALLKKLLPYTKNKERNIQIFAERYFEGTTFREIGEDYNLTHEGVRQICKKIMERIKRTPRLKRAFSDIFPNNEPPAGSLRGVFEWLCNNEITSPSNALTGEKIAKALNLSYDETIKRDLNGLYIHLHLLEKAEERDRGKKARYFVPEKVRNKADEILPVLDQFRGKKNLRPKKALLEKVYREEIFSILEVEYLHEIPEDALAHLDRRMSHWENEEWLDKILRRAGLSREERRILQADFWGKETLGNVAAKYDISVPHARKLKRSALIKLRLAANNGIIKRDIFGWQNQDDRIAGIRARIAEMREEGSEKKEIAEMILAYPGLYWDDLEVLADDPDDFVSECAKIALERYNQKKENELRKGKTSKPSQGWIVTVLKNPTKEDKYMVSLRIVNALELNESGQIEAAVSLTRWLGSSVEPEAVHVPFIKLYIECLLDDLERKELSDVYFVLSENNEEIEGFIDLDEGRPYSILEAAPWNRKWAGDERKYKGISPELRVFAIEKLKEKFGDSIYDTENISRILALGHRENSTDIFAHKRTDKKVIEKYLSEQAEKKANLIEQYGRKPRDFARLSDDAKHIRFEQIFNSGMYTPNQIKRLQEIPFVRMNSMRSIKDVFEDKHIPYRIKKKINDILIDEFIETFYGGVNDGDWHTYGDYADELKELAKIERFFIDVLGFKRPTKILGNLLQAKHLNILHTHGKKTIFDAHSSPKFGINICDSCKDKGKVIVHELMALEGLTGDTFNEMVEEAYVACRNGTDVIGLQDIKEIIHRKRDEHISKLSEAGPLSITDIFDSTEFRARKDTESGSDVKGYESLEELTYNLMSGINIIEEAYHELGMGDFLRANDNAKRISEEDDNIPMAEGGLSEHVPRLVATYNNTGDPKLSQAAEGCLIFIIENCINTHLDYIFIEFQKQGVEISGELDEAFSRAYLAEWSSSPRKIVELLTCMYNDERAIEMEIKLKEIAVFANRAVFCDGLNSPLLANIAYRKAHRLFREYLGEFALLNEEHLEKQSRILNIYDPEKVEIDYVIRKMFTNIYNDRERFRKIGIELDEAERRYGRYSAETAKVPQPVEGGGFAKAESARLWRDFSNQLLSLPGEQRDFAKLAEGSVIETPVDETTWEEPQPFFRDFMDAEELSKNEKEAILSILLSGKTLVLAFNRKLSGFTEQYSVLVTQLQQWKKILKKEYPKLAATIDSNLLFTDFASRAELTEELMVKHGLDLDDKEKNFIFTFAPKNKKETEEAETEEENLEGMGEAVRLVYIKEHEHGRFLLSYYHPLMEIAMITIVKAHMDYTKDQIYTIFATLGIDQDKLKNKLNIADIDDTDPNAFLIFTLIPRAKRYDVEERVDRFACLLQFLKSA